MHSLPPFDLTGADLERQDRWLRALVRRLAASAEVDDVVQDTWVAALRTRPTVAHPRAWLAVSAANFARRARRTVERRARRERAAARPESWPSNDESIALLELQEDVLRAVRALREPYQRAVLLRYTHGLSVAEIAAETHAAEATVRQRLKRGLDQLREALGQRRGAEWRGLPAVTAWLTPGAIEMKRNTGLVWILGVLAASSLVVALLDWPVGGNRPARPEGAELVAVRPDAAQPSESPQGPLDLESRRALVSPVVPAQHAPGATKAQVTGRVLTLRTGAPLRGVGVAPMPWSAGGVPSGGLVRPEFLALTDGEGSFVLEVDARPPSLVTDARWVPVGVDAIADEGRDALLLVAPAIAWRGVVQGPEGAPLAGVALEIGGVDLRDHGGDLGSLRLTQWQPSTTDASGFFERRDLPAEFGWVRFKKEGYRALELPIGDRDEPSLVLTLAEDEFEYVVNGHVLAPNGAPVSGARVGIGERVVRTARDGSFEHRIPSEGAPPKHCALWVAAPPYETIVVAQFGAVLLADDDRTVTRELMFRGESLELGGRVVDAEGRPVVGFAVYIWKQDALLGTQSAEELALPEDRATLDFGSARLRVWSRTDDEGRFLLSGLRDADYLLRVMNLERNAAWSSGPIHAGTRDALLQLPQDFVRERVTGRVVDHSGRPVAGAVLSPYLWEVIINPRAYSTADGRTFTTDAEGRFELRSISGGALSLHVNGKGIMPLQHTLKDGDPSTGLELVVERLCNFQLELTGERTAASYLQVLDPAGAPLVIAAMGGGEFTSSTWRKLDGDRTRVLAVGETAATLVLMQDAQVELARMPIVLRPGEVNQIRW